MSGGALAEFAAFLDFDGTLVEIADRPEAVRIAPGLTTTLARLRERLGGALALISGRPIATLDGFLAPERFDAAGLHGVEQRLASETFPCDPSSHPALRQAIAEMEARYGREHGIVIEDKGCSAALHWRLRPDLADGARPWIESLSARLGDDYRLQLGKAVAEILPASAGKGPMIGWFLQRPPFQNRRPVFIGDDLTDEHAFAAVNERGGLSIRVGPGATCASHRVAAPADVRALLGAWAAEGRIALPLPA